jgi:hydroxypyruvate isomerase
VTFSAHLSTLYTELPFSRRPAAARAAGFTAVEAWWPDGAEMAETIHDLGLAFTALNAPGLDIAAAAAYRPERINVLAEGDRDEYVAALRAHADGGPTLLVEHRSMPECFIPTPAEAAALVRELGHPNVRLLYDGFHAMRAGLDPVADLGQYADIIGHAQWADSPGRHEPGTGDGDLPGFVAALEAAGYDGPVGLEWIPTSTTAESLQNTGVSR